MPASENLPNSRLMQRSKMVSLFDHFVDATEQR
jgi:hypothetical protein